jgi:hypothetical protein
MEAGVKRGYASASTDMGTAPSNPLNGDSLVGHPQKWKYVGDDPSKGIAFQRPLSQAPKALV